MEVTTTSLGKSPGSESTQGFGHQQILGEYVELKHNKGRLIKIKRVDLTMVFNYLCRNVDSSGVYIDVEIIFNIDKRKGYTRHYSATTSDKG